MRESRVDGIRGTAVRVGCFVDKGQTEMAWTCALERQWMDGSRVGAGRQELLEEEQRADLLMW